jgi:hypothetical protein
VETRQVPDAWLRPRTPAARALAAPVPAAGGDRQIVAGRIAIPVVRAEAAAWPVPAATATSEPRRTSAATVAATTASGREPWPLMAGTLHASWLRQPRRELVSRVVAFGAGLIASLIAVEVAARVGRR